MKQKRNHGRPSIRDVAKMSGVSTATVSRAYAEPSKVTELTRSRVLEAASRLGYVRPASHTRAATTDKRPWRLSVIFQQCPGNAPGYAAHIGRMLAGVEHACQKLGCTLGTTILRGKEVSIDEVLARCDDADGVIPVSCRDYQELVQRLCREKPAVVINDAVRQLGIASFVPDDFGTIELGVNHLKALGHRRIVYFHINDASPPNPHLMLRHAAFEVLTRQDGTGLEAGRAVVLASRNATLAETAGRLLRKWFEAPNPPTALLCGNDSYASAFVQAAHRLGIDVPAQLSIVGIDDTEIAGQLHPALTSIRQPLEVIAADAVHHLVNRLNGALVPTAVLNYPVSLIERESTAAAPV